MLNNIDLDSDPVFQKCMEDLGKLAFNQRNKVGPVFTEVYLLGKAEQYKQHWPMLKTAEQWLLVPYSFWPIDLIGTSQYLVKQLREGHPFCRQFTLLMRFLRWFPAKIAQELVALHEKEVEKGQYDTWVRTNAEFEAHQKRVEASPLIQKRWREIKTEFHPIEQYQNKYGITRRYIASERNFKNEDWAFGWDSNDPDHKFYQAFTVFCAEFNLWGMEFDKPLLLKLSVNFTPFTILIGIPYYMNRDGRRDIVWSGISRVLKALGAAQAGLARLQAREAREEEALRVWDANESARILNLKGQDRIDHIIKEACLLPDTDERLIRLRLALARKLRAQLGLDR